VGEKEEAVRIFLVMEDLVIVMDPASAGGPLFWVSLQGETRGN
jgi:hypothetical protein